MADEQVAAPEAGAEVEAVTEPNAESIRDKPPERDKAQERIDKLTYEKGQLDAENRILKQRLEKPEPKKELKQPTLEESGYDDAKFQQAKDAYYEALIDQRAEEKARKVLDEREAEKKARTREESFSVKFDKLSAVEKQTVQEAYVNEYTANLIKESEVGLNVALYLGENPEIARTIANLPKEGQAREFGKLEARFEAKEPEAPKVVVSKAPPPPAKLDAVEADPPKKWNDPTLSQSDFEKARRRQIALRK